MHVFFTDLIHTAVVISTRERNVVFLSQFFYLDLHIFFLSLFSDERHVFLHGFAILGAILINNRQEF